MPKRRASTRDIKRCNRNLVFRCINNYEQISRREISSELGISVPTVLELTNELLEKGVITELGEFESTGGRRAKVIAPVHNAYFSVGMDITANHVSFVLTDLSEKVIRHIRTVKPFYDSLQYFKESADMLLEFIRDADVDLSKVLGLGISIPGVVNVSKKCIVSSRALQITNVPFSMISDIFPFECYFINDANAAAFAEIENKNTSRYCFYFSLSDTVGGAIMIPSAQFAPNSSNPNLVDQILFGDNWRSGEVGHMLLYPGGKQCYCGNYGCFDAYCSAKVLSSHTNGNLKTFMNELQDNPEYEKIWNKYLDDLSLMIANIHTLIDCQIILGGYVGGYISPYTDLLFKKVSRNIYGNPVNFIEICKYKVEASAVGAARLVMDNFINTL